MSTSFLIGGIACTIPLEELGGNAIKESVPEDGSPVATVMIQCAWADRYTVFRGLRGTTVAAGRSIIRTVPFLYPSSPNLYCMSIGEVSGIKPYRDATGWIQYHLARFPVNFGRPKYDYTENAADGQNDPSGQPWTTTKFKVSAEVKVPPKGTFYVGPYPGAKTVEEASIGIIAPNCEISMTRHFMPFVPLDEVMAAIGMVNSEPVVFSNHTFQMGELLFAGVDTNPTTDPAGNASQEVTYTLLGKDQDWNEVLAPDGLLQFLNTKNDNTGDTPYDYFDFSELP